MTIKEKLYYLLYFSEKMVSLVSTVQRFVLKGQHITDDLIYLEKYLESTMEEIKDLFPLVIDTSTKR